MMKIALFSDIHANLPALEAFLKDVDARKVDQLYCLGDLVRFIVWAIWLDIISGQTK